MNIIQPKDFDEAMDRLDLEQAVAAFASLSGYKVIAGALDDEDPILYIAAEQDGAVRGYCAYMGEDMELVVIPEASGPLFIGAPAHIIEMLDSTWLDLAIRWRRDCLAMHYRTMAERAHIEHPAWTAFYSEQPLAQLRYAAHLAVIVEGAPSGIQKLAVTDGISWRLMELPVSDLMSLQPIWDLEWSMTPYSVLAMRGRSPLSYVGVGPPEYRVGMLFNQTGGLLAWSGAASHCELMATMTDERESGFTRIMLFNQLNHWQGRDVAAS